MRGHAPKVWLLATVFGCVMLIAGLAYLANSAPSRAETVQLIQSPYCDCCGGYVAYLRRQGWTVKVEKRDDIDAVKRQAGVPDRLKSCHTASVDGYIVEGHVPSELVVRLLNEQPALAGIALPGMPAGSPGMGGAPDGRFEIWSFSGGKVVEIFAREGG